MDAPFREDHDAVCWICPALRLPAGEFDVYPKPTQECPFDPASGLRYDVDKTPVCVHPYKVGLPAGRYASQGVPVPAAALMARPRTAEEPVPARTTPARAYPGPRIGPTVPQQTDEEILAGAQPEVPDDLLSWLRGLVADAADGPQLAATLGQAEEVACERFPAEVVVEALRRALAGG